MLYNPAKHILEETDDGLAIFDKAKTTLIKFTPNEATTCYEIPEGITTIDRAAFKDCNKLEEITIPNSVSAIKAFAFSNCSSLSAIKLPEGLKKICEGTFKRCVNLSEIVIPNKVISIGNQAFARCENLRTIRLPDTIETIGSRAFYDCEKLRDVILPKNLKAITKELFSGCKSITNITLPGSIKTIRSDAFFLCTELREIIIKSGVDAIEDEAFNSCENLSTIYIPDSLTHIGSDVFDDCHNLKEIIVDENNPQYSSMDGVLYNKDMTSLLVCPPSKETITIPDSVKTITMYSFWASVIEEIKISPNVSEIEPHSFEFCYNLEKIIVDKRNPAYCSIDGVLFSKDKSCLLFFPQGKKGSYYIPNTTNTIKHGAFTDSKLTDIIIPNSVKYIEYDAFFLCFYIHQITIPHSVVSVGENVFCSCRELKTVTLKSLIPPLCEKQSELFFDCINLQSIFVPSKAVEAYKNAPGWKEYASFITPIEH